MTNYYQQQYPNPMTGYTDAPMTGYSGQQDIIGGLDDLKAFAEKETMGVKNKYLFGGLAVAGLAYFGYTRGWFD